MSKNLTAQQLADELNVTRQLIYYHAKKLPKDSKTYDEDNTLVFTPEQQAILKSYMTDTLKEKNTSKEEKQISEKKISEKEISEKESVRTENREENEKNMGENTDKSASNPLTNGVSNVRSNDKADDVKESAEQETEVTNDKTTSKEDDSDNDTASYEKTVTVKGYIQQAVKDHLEMQKKTDSEERQTLIGELEEKNAQISTLHKLLDQQQQLALVAEQKHQKLLDTLGVEDEKQLKAIVELTTNENDNDITSDSSKDKTDYEGKNWFQRLFKL